MKLTLLGTGTSQGVPVIACHCDVCQSTDPRDQRLRCSALVEIRDRKFVIDTGPDFRQQMLLSQPEWLDAVLMTHLHKDHTAGLDDIRAFNFKWRMDMPVYADARTQANLKQEYAYIFAEEKYPGVPQVELHDLPPDPFELMGIPITPIEVFHHKLPVWGFRFGDVAYVTDAKTIPAESWERLKNLDVLVLNALRREEHLSHLNLEEALGVVEALKPRRAYFTHISHLMGRHAEVEQELPPHVELAKDMLSIEADDPENVRPRTGLKG